MIRCVLITKLNERIVAELDSFLDQLNVVVDTATDDGLKIAVKKIFKFNGKQEMNNGIQTFYYDQAE